MILIRQLLKLRLRFTGFVAGCSVWPWVLPEQGRKKGLSQFVWLWFVRFSCSLHTNFFKPLSFHQLIDQLIGHPTMISSTNLFWDLWAFDFQLPWCLPNQKRENVNMNFLTILEIRSIEVVISKVCKMLKKSVRGHRVINFKRALQKKKIPCSQSKLFLSTSVLASVLMCSDSVQRLAELQVVHVKDTTYLTAW